MEAGAEEARSGYGKGRIVEVWGTEVTEFVHPLWTYPRLCN
jgi:hypothetical protein